MSNQSSHTIAEPVAAAARDSAAERSRWVYALTSFILISAATVVGTYLWSELPEIRDARSLSSNLGFFLLINLNIIVVMVLGFLVVKNIVTLILDRRRNILGAKLRSRLVTTFVGLSLVPTVLLFLVARGILESVLQGWFSPQIAASVDGALSVAKYHSTSAQNQLEQETRFLANYLGEIIPQIEPSARPLDWSDQGAILDFLRAKREEYDLWSLAVLNQDGEILATVLSPGAQKQTELNIRPNSRSIQRALNGQVIVRPEYFLEVEVLRGYAPVYSGSQSWNSLGSLAQIQQNHPAHASYVLLATESVSLELSRLLSEVVSAYEDYNELRTYRRPLASSYLLTLVVVTLLIVFAAIWVGFYLSKSLSIPIGLLAKGTAQVAHGNLDYQIPEVGDDELSILVRSFNTMTWDLKATTTELVERRRYMEAVFANVEVGVISVNMGLEIQAINIAATEMLNIQNPVGITHRRVSEVLPPDLVQQLESMSRELYTSSEKTLEANVTLHLHDHLKHLLAKVTKLLDDDGRAIGTILLLDDVTELVSAQRMAAWREVARRIAHEIKNPLTPIQLCAQRLQRRFSSKLSESKLVPADRALIDEATGIIVNQVENLRTLVNEFSRFARMPKSTPRPADLNDLLAETVSIFRQAHSEIEFELELEPKLPPVSFDHEQMARALINILDNAVSAVYEAAGGGPRLTESGGGKSAVGSILVRSDFDSGLNLATITISDTGIGIREADKTKLFEPYYSTKGGGTGLGLAIVSAIVTDHSGFIRVRDNKPQGASFVVELPVNQDGPTNPQE